jgi:orotidine-5'-phosphate decarboxylase
MTRTELIEQIFTKGTYLCVGLDTDPDKIPDHLKTNPDAVFEFNKAIIDATKDYCVAYKINTAFYEAQGLKGWDALDRTVRYIPKTHFTIADAKRGDIGNTSAQYAKAFLKPCHLMPSRLPRIWAQTLCSHSWNTKASGPSCSGSHQMPEPVI